MFQRHRAHRPFNRIPIRRATSALLALRALDVILRARDVARTADLVLHGGDARGGEEKCGGGGAAQLEVEGTVRADGDAGGDGGAGGVVGGAGVEFLECRLGLEFLVARMDLRGIGKGKLSRLTLQKSMLLTPLEPSAGPTGGEGDAWPAPTINLTIWSFAIAFRAIVYVGFWLGWLLSEVLRELLRRSEVGGWRNVVPRLDVKTGD